MNTPANPTLCRKKWGLQGYSLFPYFCYKKYGYSFKPPQRGGYWGVSNVYPQLMIWGEIRKVSKFFLWKSSSAKCNVFECFPYEEKVGFAGVFIISLFLL